MNRSSTSPFRSTALRSTNGGGSESLEMVIRSLERENNSLVEENIMLKNKSKKVAELEDKIDLVLKHNTQLLNENERLAKLINQKKSEVDLWKNKHQSLSVNRSSASELEIKRLLNQIQKLKEQNCEIEHIKNVQINELKNQQHLDIQNLKRANLGNAQKYQLQIRKLKEYCEKKEYEISDLNMKMVRMNKETDFEIGKLREEKERLRSDLAYEEAEHRKEVEGLKSKFEFNFHNEMQNLKKQHLSQIETLDYQNSKLKEVINSKNLEIEQVMAKHSKVRSNYEDSISLLKKENDQLKDKITETEHIADLELNNLRDKMEGIKDAEIALLKDAHSNQCDLLNREINKLQKFLESRNEEIEILSKERNQMRQSMEAEIMKSKANLDAQVNQNKDATLSHEEQLKACAENLRYKHEEMKTLEAYLKSQIQSLTTERDNIQRLLDRREQEFDKQKTEQKENERKLERQIQALREQNVNLKQQSQRFTRRSNGDIEDLKKMQQMRLRQLQTQIKGLEEEGKQKDSLINQLRQNIDLLTAELKATEEKVLLLENREKELMREAKDNIARWDAKEKEGNRLLREQIENMQRTKRNENDELKGIHDNKIRTLKHQIRELQRQIEDKNKNLQDLKSQYEELVNKFEEVFGQQAAKKNLDIKVPGWIPDTLALKGLFDVFLKTKVLQYCS